MEFTEDEIKNMRAFLAEYDAGDYRKPLIAKSEMGELGISHNGRMIYGSESGMLITTKFQHIDNYRLSESTTYADNQLVMMFKKDDPKFNDFGVTHKGGVYMWGNNEKVLWTDLNRRPVYIITEEVEEDIPTI